MNPSEIVVREVQAVGCPEIFHLSGSTHWSGMTPLRQTIAHAHYSRDILKHF